MGRSLSSEALVATDVDKKPEVMLYYETKGGVDTIDQMIGTYTCWMATHRRPVAVFLLMLDEAALTVEQLDTVYMMRHSIPLNRNTVLDWHN
ncbi:hypothetical protein FJT64_017285 [Amphibalanus amphitrite]|uniref:Uncharacterized protein n=1 Tax=Amphibalanus amphitrite TaxID=1232801 RepID=A0A6A4X142_AMPAM|nr:hypothetical protein FJT64_017285 [Amphibalanus amphitrite]